MKYDNAELAELEDVLTKPTRHCDRRLQDRHNESVRHVQRSATFAPPSAKKQRGRSTKEGVQGADEGGGQ